MFRNLLDQILNSKGIDERDIYQLLSSHVLTDEEIFAISRVIFENQNLNIFFSRNIGGTEVRVKIFDIEIDYDLYSIDKRRLASVQVNFKDLTLFVCYDDIKVDLKLDLLDYSGNQNKNVLYLRMQVLNEILTRYYSKILYAIYNEKRRRFW